MTIKNNFIRILLLIIVIVTAQPIQSQSVGGVQFEQKIFNAEDSGVKQPIDLPQGVLEILSKDDLVLASLRDSERNQRDAPPTWFSATLSKTNVIGKKLYIVMGIGPLRGANVTTFWLVSFDVSTHQARVILSVPTLRLEVGRLGDSPYPPIRSEKVVGASVIDARYAWIKGRYKPVAKRSE